MRDDKAQFYSGIPARWLVLAAGHIKIRMPIVEKFCYQDQNNWLGQSFGVAKAGRICQPLNSNTIYGNVWWRTVMTKVTEGYMMVCISISRLEFWQWSKIKWKGLHVFGRIFGPAQIFSAQPACSNGPVSQPVATSETDQISRCGPGPTILWHPHNLKNFVLE